MPVGRLLKIILKNKIDSQSPSLGLVEIDVSIPYKDIAAF